MIYKFEMLNKGELIKHIVKSLEESLPENLVCHSPYIDITTGYVFEGYTKIGEAKILKREINVRAVICCVLVLILNLWFYRVKFGDC
jgi:hypothetical protein